ncbi:hypothetical protein RAB80_007461 [Fusarium oxysporum f. sp. vasinfectum]|nr:hypothetical protein RAB80_007461 [Fusarium oxysporum f. sp. vasinfectum]
MSGYPVSTLDHSSIYAYPTPHQNPGPDPFPGQIRPSLPGYPAPPDNSLPQYKHADTAPLNNFFTFTYPAARDGPRPAAYPASSNTQPTRLDGTPIDGIPPSLTRLPCTARPETTHQKSHNPYKSPEIRRTHWEIEAKDGLPSADRNNKATLLLTGPFRTAKSSAKVSDPARVEITIREIPRRASSAVEESPAKTLSRSLFLSIYTCGWYHRVLAWILT